MGSRRSNLLSEALRAVCARTRAVCAVCAPTRPFHFSRLDMGLFLKVSSMYPCNPCACNPSTGNLPTPTGLCPEAAVAGLFFVKPSVPSTLPPQKAQPPVNAARSWYERGLGSNPPKPPPPVSSLPQPHKPFFVARRWDAGIFAVEKSSGPFCP